MKIELYLKDSPAKMVFYKVADCYQEGDVYSVYKINGVEKVITKFPIQHIHKIRQFE